MSGIDKHRAGLGAPDANAAELTALYRSLGCTVHDTHGVGFGFPDAVVGLLGITELVEFKAKDGRLTPPQKTFITDWRGGKVVIVRSAEDVIAHVQRVRRELTNAHKTAI